MFLEPPKNWKLFAPISSLTNIWTHIENTMPYGTGICVTVIMVFAISGILTWLLKKIPIVKLLF